MDESRKYSLLMALRYYIRNNEIDFIENIICDDRFIEILQYLIDDLIFYSAECERHELTVQLIEYKKRYNLHTSKIELL